MYTKKLKQPKKVPKFKLISYTMKAIIPTGMYANLQPEITVQAETIEQAERAVMPHIEALFAKHREGSVPQPVKSVIVPSMPGKSVSIQPVIITKTEVIRSSNPVVEKPEVAQPSIVMSVLFNRAKNAIESCKSVEALKLVSDQVKKSIKLIASEKVELNKLVNNKQDALTA